MKILFIDQKVQIWKPAMIVVGSFVGLCVAWFAIGFFGGDGDLRAPAAYAYMLLMTAVVIDYVRKSQLNVIESKLQPNQLPDWVRYAEASPYSPKVTGQICSAYQAEQTRKKQQAEYEKASNIDIRTQAYAQPQEGITNVPRAVV